MKKTASIILFIILSFNAISQTNVYLRDDFTSNLFNWNLEEKNGFSTKIEAGNLNIENNTNSSKSIRFVKNLFMYNDSDFVIETKIKFLSTDNEQYGGLIWHSKDEKNGFYFEVAKNGKVRVWANKKGGYFGLFEWKEFPELKNAESYTLKIDRKGNFMNLFVNDILVYPSGYRGQFANQIGFVVGKNTSISVDYLLVKHPPVDISDKKTAEKIAENDLFWLLNKNNEEVVEEKKELVKNSKIVKNKAKKGNKLVVSSDIFTKEISEIEIGQAIKLEKVLFERGSSILLRNSYKEIDKLAKFMNENPTIEIELSGHTDNLGNADLNLDLSEKRVYKVQNYLIEKGISKKRITGKGFGGSKPIANNDKELTRKLNRRVEFKITKK